MVRMTSVEAYNEIKSSLETKRQAVFKVIFENHPIENKMIAAILKWPINCVTGRTRELCKLGLVKEVCKRKPLNSKREVTFWGIVSDDEPQLNLF